MHSRRGLWLCGSTGPAKPPDDVAVVALNVVVLWPDHPPKSDAMSSPAATAVRRTSDAAITSAVEGSTWLKEKIYECKNAGRRKASGQLRHRPRMHRACPFTQRCVTQQAASANATTSPMTTPGHRCWWLGLISCFSACSCLILISFRSLSPLLLL